MSVGRLAIRLLFASLCCCACLLAPAAARALQHVRLHATLNPEKLGHATTVGFAFQIITAGQSPSPLTEVDLDYPGNLGIAVSELGLETCSPSALEASGPLGCPPDSVMGYGTATAQISIGPQIEQESASITIYRSPTQDEHLAMLFYVDARAPVSAQLVFPGLLLPTQEPYGGRVNIGVPLVPGLPQGPDVAVTKLKVTLGPEHVTYYQDRHGHTVPYNPKGILLPESCPRSGFPFAITLGFQDGTRTRARTAVACPHRK